MTLALYGKSRRRQGALLAAALLAVLIATIGALVAQRDARAIDLVSASGTWTATMPPYTWLTCGHGLNTDTIRWGRTSDSGCGDVNNRSGYNWTGNSVSNISFGSEFLLGTFIHYNNPIWGTSPTSVTLGLQLVFTSPNHTVNLSVQFQHHETDNLADPCAYSGPGIDNSEGCADRVLLPSLADQPFQIGDNLYILEFTGFNLLSSPSDSCPATKNEGGFSQTNIDRLYTKEDATNKACVYAKLTLKQPVVTVEKSAVSGSVSVGSDIKFKITAKNSGQPDATGWTLTDTLPSGYTWTVESPASGCSISGTTLTCSNITIPRGTPNQPGTFEVVVKASTKGKGCGTVTNDKATLTKGNETRESGSASVQVTGCGTIIIKKVVAGQGSSPTDTFTAAVNNENGSAGDKSGISFSQSSPYTHTFGGHSSGNDFIVTETALPANYQLLATWEGSGNANCPAVGSNKWDSNNPQNGERITNLGSDTKTVCFLNVKVTATRCTDLGLTLIDKFNFNNNTYQWESGSGTPGRQVTIFGGTATGGSWTSTVPIGAVIVKGGSGPVAYKIFPFPPPYPADTMIGSFDNTGLVNWGGNTPAVSHVEFCQRTSTPKGNIIVGKVKDPTAGVPNADGSQFSGTISGPTNTTWGPITFGGFTSAIQVNAGTTYSLNETGTENGWTPYGWALGSYTNNQAACPSDKNSYTAGSSISNVTVTANQTTVVCVMNTKTAQTPSISKTRATEGVSGGYAYWDISVANPENFSQTVEIHDSGATYVSHSGGTCSDTDFSDGKITCSVNANATLTVKVKKAVTPQCKPTEVNNTAAVYLVPANGGEKTLIGSAGGDNDTKYTIPADEKKCGLPTITKQASQASEVSDPADIAWVVTVTNPNGTNGITRNVWIKDQNVTVTSGPAYTGKAECKPDSGQPFEQALTSANGVYCTMPAGSSITFTVKPAKTPERACKDQTFTNTVELYLAGDPPTRLGEASSTITLLGDPKLCTRTIKVCKILEDNRDGYKRPAGTFTLTVNDGSQTTQHALDAAEGGQPACTAVTVPANATITVGETATRPADWNGDADGYPKVTQDGYTFTVTNKEKPIEVTVTFVKKICETFKDVPKNPGTDYVHVGAPVVQETVAALGDTEGKCTTVNDWEFEIWSSTTSNPSWPADTPSGGALLQKAGVGPNVLNSDALTELLNSPSKRLFVKENYQAGYMFAALKCEGDTYNNDNWEWIFWSAAKDGQVTCTAYNVPATKTITITKTWVGDSSITEEDYPTFQGLPEGVTCTGPQPSSPSGTPPVVTGTWTCTVPYSWEGQVTEVPATGWEQCTYPEAVPLNGGREQALQAATIVPLDTWLFTNCKQPSIVVKKVVTNVENDTTQFTVTLTGGESSQTGQIAEAGPVNASFTNLSITNNYTVTESGQNGYQVLGWAFANDGTCPAQPTQTGATANVGSLNAGETKTICFYNERFGNVVVDKQAPAGAVTPGTTFEWTISVSVANGPTSSVLTLTDTLPAGFTYGTPTADSPLSCTLTGLSLSCTLPQGTGIGTYKVTIPATVPTNDFDVCGETTNTVSFSGAGTQGTDSAAVDIGCVASDGRILVRKVVKGQPGDTTSFTAELTGPGITGTATQDFSQQTPGLFPGLSAGTFTVSEEPKDGYAYLGWAYGTISGDSVTCPANPTGTGSATATLSNMSPQAAICFYNEARVTIRVHKTLNVVGFTSDGQGWEFTLTGCGITPQKKTTDASGIAEFTDLPPAIGCQYTVTETVQPGWTPQFVSQTAQPVAGGQVVTLEFLNIRNFDPPCVDPNDPRCEPPPPPSTPTPTPTTPETPTPTPTGATSTPTPTGTTPPTNTPTATPTNTPVTQVAGERTPGPGASPTPLAPATGYGFGTAQGGMSLLLVLAGLVSLSLGLGFLALGRRTNR
ncbi:choice-of-anchor K domain-containing protein [Tepidiforma thermophila]|uniref:Putative repeat protein (TIGR01451 family) n=1 Tax=Tepidiforma thermophila (strain KCTC 52669 / CGMCC 1.13589 / G233) TaxID=2761530 RepID=A0A2A9HBW6_TEPT2|nr:choice-of-anchor K domain-containing protein [Tepidiforma thermophila]PFG73454.1 putative repeat protein (TIGR01451 family) [Tepidiforma thermophila]